ncbi:MAG: NADP-binding protein [Firmicutes bacterium]|nr:NADP-binding protein [Candidatus Fermentithermobacillaceae bacterium]
MSEIKVLVWGLGAMGSGMVSMLARKQGVKVVAGIARTAAKAGKDLGEIAGCEPMGVRATNDVEEAFRTKPDVVLLNTASFIREVFPEIETCLSRGAHVITIAEEMAYPWAASPELAEKIDSLAKRAGKTVLGTGINPGFVLDTLIITLTGVTRDVRHIHARRVNNLAPFGPTVMRTQGVGTTVAEFEKGLRENTIVGHIGFPQSCHLIGRALGWKIDRVVEEREPIISKVERRTKYVWVRPGDVAGCRHIARAYSGGREVIFLEHPQQVCPELEGVETGDYINIDGDPPISMAIRPEIPGGTGTIAIAVNMIPAVIKAQPGLLTMADLPIPRAILGSFVRS